MNLVDSSGWLEYFADGPGAAFFAQALERVDDLLVPSICLLEVSKVVRRERDEESALQVLSAMQRGRVVALDAAIAVSAARLGLEFRLPLADSVIFATARQFGATLWTQDVDFQALPGVRFQQKVQSR